MKTLRSDLDSTRRRSELRPQKSNRCDMSSYWKHAILSGPAPQYSSCLACLACLACSPSALLPCRHQRFVCVCGVYMCICTYIHNHAHAHTHMLFTPASSHRASSAHRERPRERERGEGGERGRRGRKGGTGRGNDSCWHIPHVTITSTTRPGRGSNC